jgi:predicted glycogen debranching enzyme
VSIPVAAALRATDGVVRRIISPGMAASDPDAVVGREWLVTNGLGGYASGTIAGVATRRYHGLLIAALPNPLGRTLMLNRVAERMLLPDGSAAALGGQERVQGGLELPPLEHLLSFRLEAGLPVWEYRIEGRIIERRVVLAARQNTVYLSYRLLEGDPVQLELRPGVHFRSHDAPVNLPLHDTYAISATDGHYVIHATDERPDLRLRLAGRNPGFTANPERLPELLYRVEARRGYDSTGGLWAPGAFSVDLTRDAPAALVASTEPVDVMLALDAESALRSELERRRRLLTAAPESARTGIGAELVLAADQFVIVPVGRLPEMARAHASGDEVRTVIAGYHWFTDWGRDTMISLEGLTLTTGRHAEAGFILRTFAHYVRDGLIPNLFPEGEREGLYHTADATLWFFHAIDRYVDATGDRWTLQLLLPTLFDIVRRHIEGTHFGIGVDSADGLLRQGAPGYQLTWMDAKVGDWVVTPRRGKAVEINALWYNALCLLERWLAEERGAGAAEPVTRERERVRESFNRRFWNAEAGCLYDVVDGENGDDPSCRPNQVFAISLPNPVLDRARWDPVLDVVRNRLLTPYGLRSLAPGHPDYKPRYYGDLRARDAAYHQGTVWGWLMGPWIDAWLKAHPGDLAPARALVEGLAADLGEFGVGSIAEVFDAEAPYTPRGCIAQAWSVAEALRCWVRTAG